MKSLIVTLICLCVIGSLHAQQINLKKGSEFAVVTHHTYILDVGRGPVRREQSFTFQFKVINNTDEGYRLSCTMYKAKLWDNFSSSGNIDKFDSDSIRQTTTHNSGVVLPLVFLQKTFDITLNPNGKFISTEGVDRLMHEAKTKWHLDETVQGFLVRDWPEFILPTIKNIFLELPTQKLGYQSTWTNNESNTSYKVTAIAGALLTITASSTDTLKAGYTLNDVNGLIEDASITINSKIDNYGKAHHDFSHKIIYDKQLIAADTAWANMAIMLSSWNGALRPKTDLRVDSAIAFGYFKKYDTLWRDDPYYITQKLTLVNQMGNFNNGIYKNLVLKTPNQFLDDDGLSNKMNYVMDTDIDQIYALVQYRYKTPNFDSWLQNSLALSLTSGGPSIEQRIQDIINQGFTRQQAMGYAMIQEKNFANANLLLERMYNDKNPIIQKKVAIMYLWINAFHRHKDATFLTKTAHQFNRLNDADMKAGDGGKYGLALYGLIKNAGINEEANTVLDKTITDLERYVADTAYNNGTRKANRDKLSAREILMIGFYIKYQQTQLTDSVKALTYLAKAAMYSPNIDDRSQYISTNRAMLLSSGIDAKASYRKDYIGKLFATGATEEAMKLFAANVTADLGSLSEMQEIYQQRFPGKNFDDFIRNNIIANWQDAPAFFAKDIKGKAYNLADYKGKWLIIDFWGTWCPPCRAEMPDLNKFNAEISDGRHPGISLLGVAVNDDEKTLTRFFNETGFKFSAVLGDGNFTGYKINAVPTKVLIAPNGKMISLYSGTDWQKVAAKLNELYAGN